jgi:hypothetical protein
MNSFQNYASSLYAQTIDSFQGGPDQRFDEAHSWPPFVPRHYRVRQCGSICGSNKGPISLHWIVLKTCSVVIAIDKWLSLVERTLGVGEVASSNLVVPTIYLFIFS